MRRSLNRAAHWALLLGLLLLQAHLVLHAFGLDPDEGAGGRKKGSPPPECQLCTALFAPKLASPAALPCLAPAGLPYAVPVPDHYETVAIFVRPQIFLRGPPAFSFA